MMMFELFTEEPGGQKMSADINTLLGYPKGGESPLGIPEPNVLTERYRVLIKHPAEELWAGAIDTKLINKCKDMSEIERDKYYISVGLVNHQYLVDNNWFPQGEIK